MAIRDWFKRKKKAEETVSAPVECDAPASAVLQEEAPGEAEAKDFAEVISEDVVLDEVIEQADEACETFEADAVFEKEPEPRLTDMDFSDFWHDIRESERRYMSAPADIKTVYAIQEKLGFKLPGTYVELMKQHNGGLLNRCWFPVKENAKTYQDYIQVTGILGIGSDVPYSLCGRFGSEFLLDGFESLKGAGIALMNSISPARAMLMLDYRKCGADGEPEVLYVNLETSEECVVARDFEAFVRGLKTSLEALSDSES